MLERFPRPAIRARILIAALIACSGCGGASGAAPGAAPSCVPGGPGLTDCGSDTPGSSNQYAIYSCNYPTGSPATCSNDVSNIAPVGTAARGAGRWTQVDLVGNVYQWMLDSEAAYVPCTDCAYVAETLPVVRGASFNLDVATLLPPLRDTYSPDVRDYIIGFRCARPAP